MKIEHFFYTLILTLFGCLLNAQSDRLSLTQNSNYNITQISTDELFIGSYEGINIYNGQELKKLTSSTHNMIGANTQSDFFEDAFGNVWFANYDGIHKYIPKQEDFEILLFQNPYSNETIASDYRVIQLEEKKLWASAGKFMFIYDTQNRSVDQWYELNSNDYRLFLTQKKDNNITFITAGQKGLVHSVLDKNFNQCTQTLINSQSHYAICKLDADSYITGTNNGKLITYALENSAVIQIDQLSPQPINKIEALTNDELLISQDQIGIYIFNLRTKESHFLVTAEETNIVKPSFSTHLLKDRILWYCIEGYGCFRKDLNHNRFRNQLTTLVLNQKIGAISPLNDKMIISQLNQNPIVCSEDNKISPLAFKKTINAIQDYGQKEKIVTSGREIYILKEEGPIECTPSTTDTINTIKRFILLDSTKFLINSANQLFTLEVNEPHYTLKKSNNPDSLRYSYMLGLERTSSFFVTSLEGVKLSAFDYKNDSIHVLNYYPISGELTSVHEEQDSFLVTTRSGLYRCAKKTSDFRPIIDKERYLKQTLYSVLPDHSNNLWLSSNTGIICYSKTTNNAYLFDKKHGLPGNEFNAYAFSKGEDGTFYFGGQSGLICFHPDSIQHSIFEPKIHLSSFQVNGVDYAQQAHNTLSEVELNYTENTLYFGFHAIDYSYGSPQTKFKMSNINENWNYNKDSKGVVFYPSLSPGNYTFSILSANTDGVWSKTPKEIHITIHPPWYATWWARSLAILVLGGTVYLTIRSYYKRQIREKELELREANLQIAKQKALSEERTRIAGEMHDDLGGGLTTIRFLSQKALRNAKNQSQKNLIQKISTNSEALVNNMSEIIWAMNSRFDSLNSLISFCRRYAHEYLEDHEVSLKFMVSGNTKGVQISGSERRNIFLALKEALHNVVKHAKATEVKISFENNEHLQIQIADNGIGFKDSNEFGNGISNMTKRIERIGGHLNIDSNNGTTISIVLPMNSS